MVMKASLQLRIGTQLTMTPQLQQAIALLQLSTLDLRQEIQQALDANPMLEQEDEFGEQAVSEPQEAEWSDSIPNELSVDSDWSDTYQDMGSLGGSSEGPDFERQAAGQSLHGHLLWQLAMTDFSTRDHCRKPDRCTGCQRLSHSTAQRHPRRPQGARPRQPEPA
jgi:RNA polymerase sigma-54 factor